MKKLIVLLSIVWLVLVPETNYSKDGSKDKYKIRTVVIDAGHGGKDPGAIGHSVAKEKHIVLNVALKLGEYIQLNYPEVKIIYTRKKDEFIELHERAAIANKANADLFISIHCNASTSSSVYGTEIYVLGLHKTEDNLNVAKRENSVILLEDNYVEHYDGFDPNAPEGHILFSLFQDAHLEQSIEFASKLDDQFATRVHRKSRGVRQAGFMVLYKTAMPSILVELGFISNKNEEAFLMSTEGTAYMASAIYRAFKSYKEHTETGVPTSVFTEDNVSFKIQFLVSNQKMETLHKEFEAIEKFEVEKSKYDFYRYLTGDFHDYKDAVMFQNQLREKGIQDAFVVAYKNGKRVSIQEAIGIVKN